MQKIAFFWLVNQEIHVCDLTRATCEIRFSDVEHALTSAFHLLSASCQCNSFVYRRKAFVSCFAMHPGYESDSPDSSSEDLLHWFWMRKKNWGRDRKRGSCRRHYSLPQSHFLLHFKTVKTNAFEGTGTNTNVWCSKILKWSSGHVPIFGGSKSRVLWHLSVRQRVFLIEFQVGCGTNSTWTEKKHMCNLVSL